MADSILGLGLRETANSGYGAGNPDAYSSFSKEDSVQKNLWKLSQYPPLQQAFDHLYGPGSSEKVIQAATQRQIPEHALPQLKNMLDLSFNLLTNMDDRARNYGPR